MNNRSLDLNEVLTCIHEGVRYYEEWRPVKNYEGLYEVSSFGRVKSFYRSKRILRQSVGTTGYYFVSLYKNTCVIGRKVHQLVSESFLNHKPCGSKLVVNHINFNKLDNRVENLEVITQRENANLKHIKSTSIYTGVRVKGDKWESNINIDGKTKYLGIFTSEEEASDYYEKALICVLDNRINDVEVKKYEFTSKHKGVSWKEKNKKWQAEAYIDGKKKYLGVFSVEEEACQSIINYKNKQRT